MRPAGRPVVGLLTIALLVMASCGADDPRGSATSHLDGEELFPTREARTFLEDLWSRSVAEGASLVLLTVEDLEDAPAQPTSLRFESQVEFRRVETLWSAPGATSLVEESIATTLSFDVQSHDWLDRHNRSDGVIAVVTPNGRVLEYSPLSTARSGPEEVTQTPLSRVLSDLVLLPTRSGDAVKCDYQPTPPQFNSESEALVRHLLAETEWRTAVAREDAIEQQTEQLVQSTWFRDPVSALDVPPDESQVVRDLRAGLTVDEITLNPSVPVIVDMTEYDGAPSWIHFVSEGRLLGTSPLGRGGTRIAVPLSPPTGSVQMAIYDQAGRMCKGSLLLEPESVELSRIEIPAIYFGTQRAYVVFDGTDASTVQVRPLEAADLAKTN